MPAMPATLTRCARPPSVAWNRSFSRRSSRSLPTNGGSSPALRPTPRLAAETRTARQSATGSGLPLSVNVPAGSPTIAASVMRRVASSTSTVPGAAAPWMRDAVLTRSPATMPWPTAPTVTAASPVATAARASSSRPSRSPRARTASTSSSATRTARSASSSWATGAPHTAMTASPMNFSTVPPWRSTATRAASK